ncbi:MAG TPA: alpha-aminoadipate/glutamate carrier protein LysW/ArgW [Nitrososphaerales archaeon]
MNLKTICTECAGEIAIPSDVVVGEIITCPDCGTDFEISESNGENVSIKRAETVGEDWGE